MRKTTFSSLMQNEETVTMILLISHKLYFGYCKIKTHIADPSAEKKKQKNLKLVLL